MVIDFHTHTFPDSVAPRAIAQLSERGGIKPHTEGTLSALKESMRKNGVDISVILPVATSVHQVESINRTAAALNGRDGIIYAGAIHPDCEDIEAVLDRIRSSGLFGIKLHPDYQGVYFDDERYIKIISEAAKRGLITVTHAGLDVAYPDDIHCTPRMAQRVIDRLGSLIEDKLALAHLGGYGMGEEVLSRLAGRKVYMDTSAVLGASQETNAEIIRRHGAKRILFATDSPWADQGEFLRLIRSYPLSQDELELILHQNAEGLLGL